MLEIYMHAVAGSTNDDFLDQVNLGVGNYTEDEYWQQVKAFRHGLYANSAMTRRIIEKARRQTKKRIVDAIFEREDSKLLAHIDPPAEPPDDPDDATRAKRRYFEEHAEDIWENLGVSKQEDPEGQGYSREEHQAYLVSSVTGIPMDWTPPHWRMLKARHEGSRSKEAHLIDNVFGRPPEPKQMQPVEDFQ